MSRAFHLTLQQQRGQSLTEFVIIALVLIPLFLALPLLAKYQDISQATEMAARYVAFDGTTRNDAMSSWKSPTQLAGEVQRRFFSNPNAPIKTNDTAGDFMANQNLFWRDPQNKSLIRTFGTDVRVSFGETLSTDRAAAFKGTSDNMPFSLASNDMELDARGIYRGNVTVTLANLSADLIGPTKSYDKFKDINLTMTRHTNLVIDSWESKGPQQVEDHLMHWSINPGNSMPMQALKLAGHAAVAVMESPRYLPGVCLKCGPKIGELEYWRDEVPADRLR